MDVNSTELLKNQGFNIIVNISNDYYEAYLTIELEKDILENLNKEVIITSLKEKNINYGIKHSYIESIINEKKPVKKVLIAEGKKHKNGEDGKIIYNFDINETPKPTLLTNGKVDHKNLNYIHKVSKGEVLATKIPPTEGSDGITVTGKNIKAKPGRAVNFKIGKNVIISDDGNLLIANESGYVKLIDNKINVIPVLEINSDVGVSTGNIIFNGKIIIRGNVDKGYMVKSEDDIEVFGIVEGSEIIANGNILIHQGCSNGAKLFSQKSIIAKFMENCIAEAQEDINCEAVLHSNIIANQKLIVEKGKGLIVGGNIKVRKEISSKTIGSHIGTSTKIQVGIDAELLEDYKNINSSINELKENAKKLEQAITILDSQFKTKQDDEQLRMILEKTLNTKRQYLEKLQEENNNLKKILFQIDELKNSRITADIIYPGVKIKINNSHYNPRNELRNIILIKEDGEIRSLPKV